MTFVDFIVLKFFLMFNVLFQFNVLVTLLSIVKHLELTFRISAI